MTNDPIDKEIWNVLPGYGVEVSSFGKVKNLETGKLLRPSYVGNGYLRVNFKLQNLLVHRLVMEAFRGPCPDKHEVNHINSVPSDNRLANLEYVTSSGNTLHAVKSGRWPVGSKRWNSVLTEDLVREIRYLSSAGMGIQAIADKFGLNYTTTYHVVKRHNWKHVA